MQFHEGHEDEWIVVIVDQVDSIAVDGEADLLFHNVPGAQEAHLEVPREDGRPLHLGEGDDTLMGLTNRGTRIPLLQFIQRLQENTQKKTGL